MIIGGSGMTKGIECWDTTYLESGIELGAPDGNIAIVGMLPALEQALRVRPGDVVTLTADMTPTDPDHDADKDGHRRMTIGCTLPEALDALRVGHRAWFDDGKIGGTVVAVRSDEADVAIAIADSSGMNLRRPRRDQLVRHRTPNSRLWSGGRVHPLFYRRAW